ncbi:MAG: methyltransferase domain-containing protein, partial [Verrucomicrobiota bacterium]
MVVGTLENARQHRWFHARAGIALSVLKEQGVRPPASILDAGCGWGTNLQALETAGYRVTGLDISRRVLDALDRPGRNLIEADLNQEPPAAAKPYDALFALDVIEHLDDDQSAMHSLSRLLRPGGLAVISVPALPDLFSDFDRIQGHRRRYVPETLRTTFEGSGLDVVKIFWWGAWMVPVLRRMRRSRKEEVGSGAMSYADYLRIPPWPLPQLMRLAFAWEQQRALNGKLKTGTSLFAVALRCQ